jgi:hypothetical protein
MHLTISHMHSPSAVLTERLARLVYGVTHTSCAQVCALEAIIILCSLSAARRGLLLNGAFVHRVAARTQQNIVVFNLPHRNAGEMHNVDVLRGWQTTQSTYTHSAPGKSIGKCRTVYYSSADVSFETSLKLFEMLQITLSINQADLYCKNC